MTERFKLSVCDDEWNSLEPDVILVDDPRHYFGKPSFKCSFGVRSYYEDYSNYGSEDWRRIVVWDLKHKKYQKLLSCMDT